MAITRITYENGDRRAVVCRTVDGASWEVHCLRWCRRRNTNTRVKRRAMRMSQAQAIARTFTQQRQPPPAGARGEG